MSGLVPAERIEHAILILRGQKVILDVDLAALYGVPVKRLNEQVKRNAERFPDDFMFQLTPEEHAGLRSQNATSSSWGGRRYPPYAFTEHGALMAASVLNSPTAVEVSILVVRAFARLRQLLATHADLQRRLDELERRYDDKFKAVFDAIRQLTAPPRTSAGAIGFRAGRRPRSA